VGRFHPAHSKLYILTDYIEGGTLLAHGSKIEHDERTGTMGADFKSRGCMIGEVMQASQQISFLDVDSNVHRGLPNTVAWTGNVIL
jgi:hypothetical protein